jgi:cell division protein FtsQ
MATYQGRALRAERGRPRPRSLGRRVRRIGLALAVVAALFGLAHLPWKTLRERFAIVTEVRVEGVHYLDARAVAEAAGLATGQDLFRVDLARARQALRLHPRIAAVEVTRRWPRGIRVRVRERAPVLLVRHGEAWEMDSTGVLLAPLALGVVADVPLLSGVSFESLPAGAQVRTPDVARGLAWVAALHARELQLLGQVSEVDVGDAQATLLHLASGTRVRGPAWPPGVRDLSALRTVLADLARRGQTAEEVDVRFRNQVIVRPVEPSAAAVSSQSG